MLSLLIAPLIIIACGLLVVPFPNLISMPSRRYKERMDMYRFSRLMRMIFCIMGFALILLGILCYHFERLELYTVSFIVIVAVGVILLFVIGHRYAREPAPDYPAKRSKTELIGIWFAVGITVAVFGACFYVGMPATVKVEENRLHISGAYGVTLPLDEIERVELRDHYASMGWRSNGLSFHRFHKGYFTSDELGAVRLFFHSGHGPYLLIYPQEGRTIILNRSREEEVRQLYNALQR